MTHNAEKGAGYEPCVTNSDGDCSRWSHDHRAEKGAAAWGHWCCDQTPTTLPASTPRCPQCGALDLSRARPTPPEGGTSCR